MRRLIFTTTALALLGCDNMVGAPEPVPEWAAGEPSVIDPCESPSVSAVPPRLLTRYEYDNAVFDLFGVDGAPAGALPSENAVAGFRTDANAHRASSLLVERHVSVAREVAEAAVARDLPGLAPCASGGDLLACGERFIATRGRRVFRRPLNDEEIAIFRRLFAESLPTNGYAGAVALTLQAMLQSPQFLYRLEPAPDTAGLDGFAVASRLSFLLWRSTPDDALLDAAESGGLADATGILEQAQRMREDRRIERLHRDFASQWLGLDRFEGFTRDALDDEQEAELARALTDSAIELVARGFRRGFDTLMTDPELLLDGPRGLYDPSAPRAGLLTHPALLSLLSSAYGSSPVRRGVYVREHLFCEPLPSPPPDINIEAPSPDPNATTRERFAQHTGDSACAGCHVRIDPIGFGLENYDELGRYRVRENGVPVDSSGEVVGAEDPALNGPFEGAVELAHRMASSEQVRGCVANEFYRFAMGGAAGAEDACTAHRVAQSLIETGSFDAMLETLVTSDAFRLRRIGDAPADEIELDPEWLQVPQWVEDNPPEFALDAPAGTTLSGWANDVDAPDTPLRIEVYFGAPMGVGGFLGAAFTELDRPDAPARRGFELDLPAVSSGETLHVVVFDPLNGATVVSEEVVWP